MAIVYTYPIGSPAAGDLLVGTKTPVEGEAFEPNKTLNFTVQSIIDLINIPDNINGTVGKIPVFTTATTVGDSIITQSNGYIGIGTTTPSTKLDVNGNVNASGDGYAINGMGFAIEYSGVLSLGDWDGSDFQTRIMDEHSHEVLRVADGKVGIGTTNPNYPLVVNGIAASNKFFVPAVPLSSDWVFQGRNSASTADSGIHFDSGNGELLLRNSANLLTSRLRSSGDSYFTGGNLGIGTTNPGSRLEVNTGFNSGSDGIFIKDEFAGRSRIISSKNPILSLGTSSDAGSTATIFMGKSDTATDQDTKIEFDRTGGTLTIACKGQATLRDHVQFGDPANATPKSVFFGNVGIGTTSPQSTLDVDGILKVRSQIDLFSGSNQVLSIFSSGGAYPFINSPSGQINFGAPSANTTNIFVQGNSSAKELESTESDKGLILKSPDGTKYRVTVANGGTLSVSAV